MLWTIPNILSLFRIAAAPVLLLAGWLDKPKLFFFLFGAMLISDALDGFIARMLNQTSQLGARLDSYGDILTYLSTPLALWWLYPELILKEKFTDVRVMDISRNIIWSEVRAILISIPYVFLVLFKKLLKGKGYDASKDPSFYLAVAILSPVMGLSKTSGYYAIVGEKDSKII